MDRGYWKFWRKTKDSHMFEYPYQFTLWCYLLNEASYNCHTYPDGTEIGPGELVTSLGKLAACCGQSIKQIRTGLKNLVASERIEVRASRRHTKVTIKGWSKYQSEGTLGAHLGHTRGNNKEGKKGRRKEEDNTWIPEWLSYLNTGGGFQYRATADCHKKALKDIRKMGGTIEDWRLVVDHKLAQWGHDPQMRHNINPTTIKRHWDTYLDQAKSREGPDELDRWAKGE